MYVEVVLKYYSLNNDTCYFLIKLKHICPHVCRRTTWKLGSFIHLLYVDLNLFPFASTEYTGVAITPIFSSLAAQQVVITTIHAMASDDKFGI